MQARITINDDALFILQGIVEKELIKMTDAVNERTTSQDIKKFLNTKIKHLKTTKTALMKAIEQL